MDLNGKTIQFVSLEDVNRQFGELAELVASKLKAQMDSDVFLSVAEASQMVRVSPSTLRSWVDKGLPHTYVKGTERFIINKAEFKAWLRKNQPKYCERV